MCDALCELQPELANTNTRSSRSSREVAVVVGNFPSAKEIASLSSVKVLERRCHLGYRAKHILKLAKNVESNRLKLEEFEQQQQQLYAKLIKMKGFGPFACANILMCIGFYQRIAQDSETIRHLSHFHARKNCNAASIQPILEEIYGKYEPFQFLAYW